MPDIDELSRSIDIRLEGRIYDQTSNLIDLSLIKTVSFQETHQFRVLIHLRLKLHLNCLSLQIYKNKVQTVQKVFQKGQKIVKRL